MTRRLSGRWTLANKTGGIALGTLPLSMVASLLRDSADGREVGLARAATTVLFTIIGLFLVLFHLRLKRVDLAPDGIGVKSLTGKYNVALSKIRQVSAWHPLGLKLLFTCIPHVVVRFREPVRGRRRVMFLARVVPGVGFRHPHPDVLLLRRLAEETEVNSSSTAEVPHE